MKITRPGRALREELNEALREKAYVPFDKLPEVSMLCRRAARYARMQEDACSYEWASGEKWEKKERRLEKAIEEIAAEIPGVTGVRFSGDPRGFTVSLHLTNQNYNTWGGVENGWGIA